MSFFETAAAYFEMQMLKSTSSTHKRLDYNLQRELRDDIKKLYESKYKMRIQLPPPTSPVMSSSQSNTDSTHKIKPLVTKIDVNASNTPPAPISSVECSKPHTSPQDASPGEKSMSPQLHPLKIPETRSDEGFGSKPQIIHLQNEKLILMRRRLGLTTVNDSCVLYVE